MRIFWRRVAGRFTPTGVGTMFSSASTSSSATVHPHGRGDNDGSAATMYEHTGSPPRAWGQLLGGRWSRCARRFTPTGVGTITVTRQSRTLLTVHPHGRGDNPAEAWSHQPTIGSPPRAWGQSAPAGCANAAVRFTPTGVGTIADVQVVAPDPAGSPPRAWGQCCEFDGDHGALRFTPTGVGTIPSS